MKYRFIVLALLFSNSLSADETFWELGVGVTTFNTPLYPGASEDDTFVIPFPYFRIQSEHFEVDDGVRGFLYESPDYRLNISAALGVPVDSSESSARSGMPNLDTVLQVGPSFEIIFSGGRRKPHEFRLELPLRAAIATDLSSAESAGWIFEPRLSYETLRPFKSGWAYQARGGLRFATEDFHAYYYDVPLEFATPERSEYHSDAGYGGAFIDFTGNWRQNNLIYFAFLRYQNLSGAAFEDSPLVEDSHFVSMGVGVLWLFADSRK